MQSLPVLICYTIEEAKVISSRALALGVVSSSGQMRIDAQRHSHQTKLHYSQKKPDYGIFDQHLTINRQYVLVLWTADHV
jgi:hypothetical protein